MEMQDTQTVFARTPDPKATLVLLVEDESVVREITSQVLENAGYHVLKAASPKEALQLVHSHPGRVDLLLTDVVMPGMNGLELADQLCLLYPGLITIFMSGYAENDVLRRVKARPWLHLQKPFTVSFLLSRIAEALGANSTNEHAPRVAMAANPCSPPGNSGARVTSQTCPD